MKNAKEIMDALLSGNAIAETKRGPSAKWFRLDRKTGQIVDRRGEPTNASCLLDAPEEYVIDYSHPANPEQAALDTLVDSLFECGDVLFDSKNGTLEINNLTGTEIPLTEYQRQALIDAGVPDFSDSDAGDREEEEEGIGPISSLYEEFLAERRKRK